MNVNTGQTYLKFQICLAGTEAQRHKGAKVQSYSKEIWKFKVSTLSFWNFYEASSEIWNRRTYLPVFPSTRLPVLPSSHLRLPGSPAPRLPGSPSPPLSRSPTLRLPGSPAPRLTSFSPLLQLSPSVPV